MIDKELELQSIFNTEIAKNDQLITNSERYAALTLPSEFLRDETRDYEEVEHDYQSIGGVAVSNLANKIMNTLFDTRHPFFRAEYSKEQKQELMTGVNADGEQVSTPISEDQILKASAQAEKEAIKGLQKRSSRTVLTDTVLQLIITGNALLRIPEDESKNYQMYTMRNYIVKRDAFGEFKLIIVCIEKQVKLLDDKLKERALANKFKEDDKVKIYTGIKKVGQNEFKVWQEMENVCVCHEEKGTRTQDEIEYIPLTWKLATGRDYGTGLVEMHRGVLEEMSIATQTLIDQMAILSDIKYLVNPSGMTDVRQLAQSRAGSYVQGREQDIAILQANNVNAIQGILANIDRLKREIGTIFLLNSAVTRDAERVTAQEIRLQAQELEAGLGGVYSRLGADLQLPIAKRLLRDVNPIFSKVEPTIISGVEGLSRGADQQKINAMMQDLAAMANVPEQVLEFIDMAGLIATLGANYGVDYSTFLKDEAAVQEARRIAAEQQAMAAGQQKAMEGVGQNMAQPPQQ